MIILASSSPTRAKLLKDFKIDFVQKPVAFDEDSIQSTNPKEFVYLAAMGKFKAAYEALGNAQPLLVADSVIEVSGRLQRKAKNLEQATSMLLAQSGQSIEIITCMLFESKKFKLIDISSTKYSLKSFESSDLNAYLESKDWQGKAGCVMVEGFHKKYITSQIGFESNALGLCVEKILPFLEII